MAHPLAIPGGKSGAFGMTEGDRVVFVCPGAKDHGRSGVADEFLSDGEAFVTWDDGTYGTVKWNYLRPAPHLPAKE